MAKTSSADVDYSLLGLKKKKIGQIVNLVANCDFGEKVLKYFCT